MGYNKAYFSHRSCYVNFAEHLQNAWIMNLFYPKAPNQWFLEDWKSFLFMIKSFGFNCFEYWLTPMLYDKPALKSRGIYKSFAETMQKVNEIAHSFGLKTKFVCGVSCVGPEWHFLCFKNPEEKRLILGLWKHWVEQLSGTDIVGIFPGDPGGCNRNGCNHETFVDIALEISEIIKRESPNSCVEIGTWGTPFSGWGDDLRRLPGWDGSWSRLTDEKCSTPETPCHIWNGKPARAKKAMEYFLKKLPFFPEDTMVAINLGFSPDGDATMGGDAREYAREIAQTRSITTWDYSLAEGELVCYPHWRLPRIFARRREERSAAPYIGGMSYTMAPKLNLMSLYAAGQSFINPDKDPDQVSREFCAKVFGEESAILGELFEAFEIVKGWGHYPRRQWSKEVLAKKYQEIIDILESADMSGCSLPLFSAPDDYRSDLLWFARRFKELAGPNPDRRKIKKEYWSKVLSIYDVIPMSADKRAEESARQFSEI